MSFILDALRKSESERRRDDVPDITQLPLATARLGLPPWVVPVVTALGLAVVGLAAGWWYAADSVPAAAPSAPAAARTAPGAATSGTERAKPDRVSATEAEAETEAGPAPPPAAGRDVVPLRELAAGPAPAPADAAAPPRSSAAAPKDSNSRTTRAAPTEVAAALPRAADLRAEGIAVPQLKLELHVYSESPANRFVFVNGNRYGEGDTLASGEEVVRVTPEGVVLSEQGRHFLLLPD